MRILTEQSLATIKPNGFDWQNICFEKLELSNLGPKLNTSSDDSEVAREVVITKLKDFKGFQDLKGIQDLKGTSMKLESTNKTTVGFILANRFFVRFFFSIVRVKRNMS
jgi:hypothetical protein